MSAKLKSKKKKTPSRSPASHDFPIAAIGASAGGLESVSKLLSSLSPSPGIALVLIQHISPDHLSSLVPLLSRVTKIKVLEVTSGTIVRPNHLYIVPPAKDLFYSHPVLRLKSRDPNEPHHMPIDQFMESLARSKRSRAIGIILSGTGSDGTRGLQKIHEAGGITFVQSEQSAKFGGMPHSAIAAGCADFVLPPARIAAKLDQFARRAGRLRLKSALVEPGSDAEAFRRILELIRSSTGTDFSLYRQSTLSRRIRRRMVLKKFRDLREYLKYLAVHDQEVRALHQDILINVTSFFRDAATFEALKKKVLSRLLKGRDPDSPIRIWVPGCATGEEVYSIAICLLELIERRPNAVPFQIFGTDISEESLKKAHAGIYSPQDLRRVSAGRLKQFFIRVSDGFQIKKSLRERCLFAKQDIISDTPFSRMDLIACRNVLIYISTALQNRVIPIFHYALNSGGYLLLGNSENLVDHSNLFSPVDRAHRIFRRRPGPGAATLPLQLSRFQSQLQLDVPRRVHSGAAPALYANPDAILLARRGPPAVLVNSELEILRFCGQLGPYLDPAAGEASLNLLKMARAELVWELRAAVQRSMKTKRPSRSATIRHKGGEELSRVTFEVIPVLGSNPRESVFWIVFDAGVPPGDARSAPSADRAAPVARRPRSQIRMIAQLERELVQTKAGLQEIIHRGAAANEELEAANEEILSRNEELQSINEEFETSKEELQSSNEELTTLNEELEHRHSELVLLHNDLTNLFGSLHIPIVILGRDHTIRRFSQSAASLFNLMPGDIGRSLGDLHFGALYSDLRKEINTVIETGKVQERSVQGPDGRWLSIRMHPYRTPENEIQGAILFLVDVHDLKQALDLVEEQREYAQAIISTIGESLLVLDSDLRVITANNFFYETFKVSPVDTIGNFLYKLGNGQWNIPQLRKFLHEVLIRKLDQYDYELDRIFPAIGPKKMLLNARRLHRQNGFAPLVLLTIRDKTSLERALHMSARLLQVQDEERQRLARELHDSTAQSLSALRADLNRLEKLAPAADADFAAVLAESHQFAESAIKELRTVSYLLHPPILEHAGLASAIRSFVCGFAKRSSIRVQIDLPARLPRLSKDLELALFRITQESLNNIHQHSDSEVARIRLAFTSSKVVLTISDKGRGFRPGLLHPDGSLAGGDGVGIPSMQERARQFGGALEISSRSSGVTIRAIFPLVKR